jgi:hypothetical protein
MSGPQLPTGSVAKTLGVPSTCAAIAWTGLQSTVLLLLAATNISSNGHLGIEPVSLGFRDAEIRIFDLGNARSTIGSAWNRSIWVDRTAHRGRGHRLQCTPQYFSNSTHGILS